MVKKSERLTPQEKFELVIGSYQTDNVADYCREKDIDRSYLYQLRREHQESATSAWEAKKPGRPPNAFDEASPERVKELEKRCEALVEERDNLKLESAVAGLVLNVLDEAGAFEDKQIKKKLPRPALDLVSEMRLNVLRARERSS